MTQLTHTRIALVIAAALDSVETPNYRDRYSDHTASVAAFEARNAVLHVAVRMAWMLAAEDPEFDKMAFFQAAARHSHLPADVALLAEMLADAIRQDKPDLREINRALRSMDRPEIRFGKPWYLHAEDMIERYWRAAVLVPQYEVVYGFAYWLRGLFRRSTRQIRP
jgi:hypothetical protein